MRMHSKVDTSVEKRQNPRFACAKPKDYKIDFKGDKETGCLLDLSRGGLALQSSRHFEQDEICKFEVWVSVLEKPVSCEARVMWVRHEPKSKNYTCGAKILKIDPSSKVDLLDVLYQDWKKGTVNSS